MTASDSTQALAFVLLVVFLAYVSMIIVPFVRRKKDIEGDPAGFDWHFFVPCRDEEAVIGDTITRLREQFPQAHVWVIDDDSTDRTSEIIVARSDVDSHVHLVQRRLPNARTGKGDALNAAYHALDGWLRGVEAAWGGDVTPRDRTVVVVVDADGLLAENALRQAAGDHAFADPQTGAAQAAVWMSNRDDDSLGRFGRYLVRMQDIEFRTTIAAMQCLRGHTLSVGLGGNGQFTRLTTLDAIAGDTGTPWHGSLLEDYELGIHVMLAGYHNVYLHDTHVEQEALPQAGRLLTQRTRWCQGGMQCARYLGRIFTSQEFTNAGAIEAAYFLLMPFLQLAGTVLWPTVFLVMVIDGTLSTGSILTWAADSWWLLPLIALTGIMPFAIWPLLYWRRDERKGGWLKVVYWALGYWLYMYQSYATVLRAFGRLVMGRTEWAKTRRNAEPPAPAAPISRPVPSAV